MNSNEFWCRAFLAAMGGNYTISEWDDHSASADVCERAADAHLAVAQRRGMVTGERGAAACSCAAPARGVDRSPGPCRVCGGHVDGAAPGPKLERVEFTAEPRGARGSGLWELRTATYPEGLFVVAGDKSFTLHDGNRVRIKWGETSPPKPIEVWIERGS